MMQTVAEEIILYKGA